MFRLWGKIWKDNRIIKQMEVLRPEEDTRTHKVFHGLEEIVVAFELTPPIWMDKTVRDFKQFRKARFDQDCFIQEIDFDYLEIEILEEDV